MIYTSFGPTTFLFQCFQWCIQARCVPDGTKPPTPVDGNWGSWSAYSECSKDCGIGVQWKTRKCDNPP